MTAPNLVHQPTVWCGKEVCARKMSYRFEASTTIRDVYFVTSLFFFFLLFSPNYNRYFECKFSLPQNYGYIDVS